MKKSLAITLVITVALMAMALVMVPLASANAGPHGGYNTVLTDACAGCHRAHTAAAEDLLVEEDPELCLSCHGAANVGANTDVEMGMFQNTGGTAGTGNPSTVGLGTLNQPLKGGGFDMWKWENGTYITSTSAHYGNDAFGMVVGAWGLGAVTNPITGSRGVQGVAPSVKYGKYAAPSTVFRCTACHNPHGNTNWRMLQTSINGQTITVTSAYGTADESGKKYTTDVTDNYGAGISSFCGACHPAYWQTGSGTTGDPTTGILNSGGFTHRVDFNRSNSAIETTGLQKPGDAAPYHLPLADTTGAGGAGLTVTCLTCHVAHGTSVYENGNADLAAGTVTANISGTLVSGLSTIGTSPTGDSALLRLPNRGMCEACHNK